MASLPQIWAQPVRVNRFSLPRATANDYGAGIGAQLGELGDALIKQSQANDKAEAESIASSAWEAAELAVQENANSIGDADEFRDKSRADVRRILDGAAKHDRRSANASPIAARSSWDSCFGAHLIALSTSASSNLKARRPTR